MNLHSMSGGRRLVSLLLVIALCLSFAPGVFAEQVLYRDPQEHWKKAANRTNELDVNSVTTTETFYCYVCSQPTAFTVWRTPEYTRDGQTALTRNVKYSDGTMLGGEGTGTILDGVPGVDSVYTGYHWTKACCDTCGTLNSNVGASDYSAGKNIYWLYDCDANFIEKLDDQVTIEYVDETYHMVTTEGGSYCAFCYGTHHTHDSELVKHTLKTDILPQLGHQRFAIVTHCTDCEYMKYEYVGAKSVITNYFGLVDGQPHTLTVTDLSETGVTTTIRYGNAADDCTMTSAPNFTEEGQYTVYYQITYLYQGTEMTENGVAYVWLRDESSSSNGNTCTCGCTQNTCDCQNSQCTGCDCGTNCHPSPAPVPGTSPAQPVPTPDCGENHKWTLLETVAATCTMLGYDRYLCTECGEIENRNYVSASGHEYQSFVIREADCEHEGRTLKICTGCGSVEEITSAKGDHNYKTYQVEAGCTMPGYTVQECTICGGRNITNITAVKGHTYVTTVTPATCTTDGHTLHVCSDCGDSYIDAYTEARGHDWDSGVVIQDATCTSNGIIEYHCNNCAETRLEPFGGVGLTTLARAATPLTVSPLTATTLSAAGGTGHNYVTTVTEPTCEKMGYTSYVCVGCGENYKSDYVDALGHDYRAVVTAPTCTTGGYTTYTCYRCGKSYVSNNTPALGHDWHRSTLTESTCNTDGIVEYDCSRCDAHYHEAVAAKGHKAGAAATCVKPQTCTECGAVLTPANGHRYFTTVTQPTCVSMGYTTYTCVDCGESYVADYVDATNHNYKAVETAPTCAEAGYTTYTCSVCGDSYVSNTVAALGHDWHRHTVTNSSCNGAGLVEYGCSRCGAYYSEALSSTGHRAGPAATCTTPQTCLDCGAVLATAANHRYYETVTAPTCTTMGYTTYSCVDCHDTYKAEYRDALGHNYKAVVTVPTCTSGGYTTFTCTRCGDSYIGNPVPALGHDYQKESLAESSCNSEGLVEYHCSRCNAHYYEAVSATGHKAGAAATCLNAQTCQDCGAVLAAATGHNYTSVITDATCTKMGYTTYTCSGCGDTYRSDYTEMLGHAYKETVTRATCTEGGYTTYTCQICGDSYVGDYTDALGHDWKAPTVLADSTCNSDGIKEYDCSRCDAHYHEAVSATGHNPGAAASCLNPQTCLDCGAVLAPATGHNYKKTTTEPTCTRLGYTVYVCENCGESYRSDYTEMLGHDYETEVTAPTCANGGYTTYTCARCGASYVDDFTTLLGHDWKAPVTVTESTCISEGVLEYDCSRCDAHYLETMPAKNHAPGPAATCVNAQTCLTCGAVLAPAMDHHYQKEVTLPTCTTMGYSTYTCADCGRSYKSDYTDPTGHSYVAVVTAPTCLENGYTTYTCSKCGDSYVDNDTAALGHNWDNGTVVTLQGCDSQGVTEYRCSRCNEHRLEAVSAKGHRPGNAATCTEDQVCLDCGIATRQRLRSRLA